MSDGNTIIINSNIVFGIILGVVIGSLISMVVGKNAYDAGREQRVSDCQLLEFKKSMCGDFHEAGE